MGNCQQGGIAALFNDALTVTDNDVGFEAGGEEPAPIATFAIDPIFGACIFLAETSPVEGFGSNVGNTISGNNIGNCGVPGAGGGIFVVNSVVNTITDNTFGLGTNPATPNPHLGPVRDVRLLLRRGRSGG